MTPSEKVIAIKDLALRGYSSRQISDTLFLKRTYVLSIAYKKKIKIIHGNLVRRPKKVVGKCLHCNKEIINKPRNFCCSGCRKEYEINYKIKNHLPIGRKILIEFLKKRDGFMCAFCKNHKWLGFDIDLFIHYEFSQPLLICSNCKTYIRKNV